MSKFDVFGIGNPLIDVLAHVPETFLKETDLEKDRMYLVDLEGQQELFLKLAANSIPLKYASGGSCANTMIAITQLGGNAAFTGKLGKDEHGQIYQEKLRHDNVALYMGEDQGMTGSSLILVTDDGSRTMNTCLGMCQELHSSDISEEGIANSQILYFTGYLWDTEPQKDAVLLAAQYAKKHGVQIAMSLSDPFCVNRHQDDFKKLLKEQVDIVFCNQEEAFALTETQDTQEAAARLSELCSMVVLTLGSKGALIQDKGEITYIDPVSVKVEDTTGAGDSFAGGFLYGYTQGKSHLESGKLAARFAAQVISHLGPRLERSAVEVLK